eukprot:1128904-Pleurochrysis_carterae.AAC.1
MDCRMHQGRVVACCANIVCGLQMLRRHLDEYTLGCVSAFYRGMGAPLDLLRKDGTKHDKWF